MSNLSPKHFRSLDYLWGYISHTRRLGLLYNLGSSTQDCRTDQQSDQISLIGSTDADWGGDNNSRRSTTGHIFLLQQGKSYAAISWLSKLQPTVALSSAEAEFMAYKEAIKQSIYLEQFLNEIRTILAINLATPTTIYSDSQSAIQLSKNPTYHARTKHIDIQYYFVREKIEQNQIRLLYQHTNSLLSDCLTKAVSTEKIKNFLLGSNLVDLAS